MHIARLIVCILTAWLKTSQSQCVCVRISFHLHAIHDVMCLSVRWSFLVFSLSVFLSVIHIFSSTLYLFSARHSIFNVDNAPRVKTTALTQNEEYCSVAIYNPLTELLCPLPCATNHMP